MPRMYPAAIAAAAFAITLPPGPALAQVPATSLDELRLKVGVGDTVYVTDSSGREGKATIVELSRSALVVSVDGVRHAFQERDVQRVRQRRPDSLLNGAIIGGAIGAGFGILAVSFSEECSDQGGASCAGPVLAVAGLYAAVGIGIDAIIQGRKVIYERPISSTRVRVTPLLGRNRIGFNVGVRLFD